nr:hypothetical protein CFP56_03702 [Quercus suber]
MSKREDGTSWMSVKPARSCRESSIDLVGSIRGWARSSTSPQANRALDVVHADLITQHDAFLQDLTFATVSQAPCQLPDGRHGLPPLMIAERTQIICGQRAGHFGRTEGLGWISALQELLEMVLQDLRRVRHLPGTRGQVGREVQSKSTDGGHGFVRESSTVDQALLSS